MVCNADASTALFRVYEATTAGTSGTGAGPTGTGTAIVDGSVVWKHRGDAGFGPWKPSTAYDVGHRCVSLDGTTWRLYVVASIVGDGKSAASGGPTGTGTGIVDGNVRWDHMHAAAAGPTGTGVTKIEDGTVVWRHLGAEPTGPHIRMHALPAKPPGQMGDLCVVVEAGKAVLYFYDGAAWKKVTLV